MSKPFRFRQFNIEHNKSAMKVGTDGVLLGAWVNHSNPLRILDIGAGSGLITLMLAQRFPQAKVIGVEIDKEASEEAKLNIENSTFKGQCKIRNSSIQAFRSKTLFDLIVSNPPYFVNNKQLKESKRILAREQIQLTFNELLKQTKTRINPNGKAAFIIPYTLETNFLQLAKAHQLYLEKITHVKGSKSSKIKRSLLLLSAQPICSKPNLDELVIELKRHKYTKEYKQLTQDFYL